MAIEAKAIQGYKAFGVKDLSPHQRQALDDFDKAGGCSLVALNVREPRKFNRCLFFTWPQFKLMGTWRKQALEDYPYIEAKRGEFDLSEFFFYA